MHIPTCPVKMAGTLQRRCANCHYVFTGAIFGVWFFMVKQGISLRFNDMPTRLPLSSLLVPVRRIKARLTVPMLARYSSAVVLLPVVPTPADWAALPHGTLLRHLYGRKARKAGDLLQLRVGARAETLLTAALVPTGAGTFERLQSASKLARCALDGDPQTLLLWQQGCDAQAADAALSATVAALEAAVFRFATFKTRPNARERLARIDLKSAAKPSGLDVTLATAAG